MSIPAPRKSRQAPAAAAAAFGRNLFNGDCNFFFYNPELWQPEGGRYRSAAIHRCVRRLADGGIDTLLVNPNTQVAWYPSRVAPHILDGYRRGDLAFARRIARANAALHGPQVERYAGVIAALLDRYLDLAEDGCDWLAESARACRGAGVTPWLSYRMNPTHFSGWPASPVNAPVFRDPRNRLAGRPPGGRRRDPVWLGLDYARAVVRDHMFALIREGVEDYDFAGVELDWLRHPLCIEFPARDRDRDMMTAWIADLRALTRRRPGPYPLGLRLPGNLDYLRGIGLDLPRLTNLGLIDFVVFSNYWQTPWTMPFDELRAKLGPDLRIYAGIEGAPNWLPVLAPGLPGRPELQELQLAGDHAVAATRGRGRASFRGMRSMSACAPLLRGAAAGKLVLPVDGVEQYNFFVADQVRVPGQHADYAALCGLGDLGQLRGRPKQYAFNTASGNSHERWDAPMAFPATIPPGTSRIFRLPMCAEPRRAALRGFVQVIASGTPPLRVPSVKVNTRLAGRPRATDRLLSPAGPYRCHVPEHRAWNVGFPVAVLRDGWNEITIRNEDAAPLRLVGLEVAVKRRPKARR